MSPKNNGKDESKQDDKKPAAKKQDQGKGNKFRNQDVHVNEVSLTCRIVSLDV